MRDLFDLFSDNDYSRIRRRDDEYEDTTEIDIDDTDEAEISELVELDVTKEDEGSDDE